MTGKILENAMIADIVRGLPRRRAIDAPADAELIAFDARGETLLAVSSDSLSEEIATGLYDDPVTIGWVLVMSTASDLAAVGARLLGVSVVFGLPADFSADDRERLSCGVGDAARELGVAILGGDTNRCAELVVSACAIGLVERDRALTCRGARAGDVLYVSGPVGFGNAYALATFTGGADDRPDFRPRARFDVGDGLEVFASCAMDTSDGVLATLDELARVNGVGFRIDTDPREFVRDDATALVAAHGMPVWLALAGCHGEFELAFTVPAQREKAFLEEMSARALRPLRVGAVTEEQEISFAWSDPPVAVDTARLRNEAFSEASTPERYIRSLVEYAHTIGK